MKKENDTLDRIAQQYTSVEELKQYSDAQYRTIVNLSKEIQTLKTENEELKKKSEDIKIEGYKQQFSAEMDVTDEEAICVIQLKRLKDIAMLGDLTLEEARKTEIYIKALNLIRGSAKKAPKPEEKISNENLLELMNSAIDLK